jgi:hypothetical protein
VPDCQCFMVFTYSDAVVLPSSIDTLILFYSSLGDSEARFCFPPADPLAPSPLASLGAPECGGAPGTSAAGPCITVVVDLLASFTR